MVSGTSPDKGTKTCPQDAEREQGETSRATRPVARSTSGMAQADGAPCPGTTLSQPCVFKLVLLGSGSVGKSSLAFRYVKNDFKSILPTVG
uniref:Ras-related protein Rab-17 n=1 Tax=Sus scrofa TaxID=9823 RepID=A0A8D1UX95_PIG